MVDRNRSRPFRMDPMGLGALFGSIVTFVVVGAVVQTFWVSVGAAVGAFIGAVVGWVLRHFVRKPAVGRLAQPGPRARGRRAR